jgi:hypothetical protein
MRRMQRKSQTSAIARQGGTIETGASGSAKWWNEQKGRATMRHCPLLRGVTVRERCRADLGVRGGFADETPTACSAKGREKNRGSATANGSPSANLIWP